MDSLAEFLAVHFRHVDIAQDKIRAFVFEDLERSSAVLGLHDLKSHLLEAFFYKGPHC
ncbi:MAG: hypothetical protein BWZ01_02464 [Deltaproteobacteria bacterium ADurb.BinA179]|nr:MAG: hypothetical protein BWZ01_02464 [Deltaproteobacteria bacterium ADurb.BinA179]